jgi:hypothetical protein
MSRKNELCFCGNRIEFTHEEELDLWEANYPVCGAYGYGNTRKEAYADFVFSSREKMKQLLEEER